MPHKGNRKIAPLPGGYEGLMESYLSYCRKNGNKEGTVIAKKSSCRRFLKYLTGEGISKKQVKVKCMAMDEEGKGIVKIRRKKGQSQFKQKFVIFATTPG